MPDTQMDSLLNQLLADGLLDEQFSQLMQLQDESNPHFVAEVLHARLLACITRTFANAGQMTRVGNTMCHTA